jgi:uncharacterized protein
MTIFLWILALAMIAAGVVGTVRPILPGPTLVFAGVALAAWIDHFTRISGWTVGLVGALAVAAFFADSLTRTLGAKRANASPLAITGAAIGSAAGTFTTPLLGPIGLLVLPLMGAMIGDYATNRSFLRAGKVGLATWFGTVAGTAARLAITFTMIGIFAAALLI